MPNKLSQFWQELKRRKVSAKLYFHQGEFEDALRELVICDEIQKGHPWIEGMRWRVYWLQGREAQAYESYRNDMSNHPRIDIDVIDSVYNVSEQVFYIQFKPLHDNPRFLAILEGMGLGGGE